MLRNVFKSILVFSLLVSANMAFADFAACPSASDAQKIVNSAAGSLTPVASPATGWTLYQATATDLVTIDYYTQVKPSNNVGDHVKYLATFLQGAASNFDTATLRHCYYPVATGSLDATGAPQVPSVIVPGLEGKAQVLALEYAAGVDPGPGPGPGPTPVPTTTTDVQVSFVFPTGVTPPATVSSVTLTNSTMGIFSVLSANTAGAVISKVPTSTAGITYSYSASGATVGAQNYCASSGTTTVSTAQHSFIVNYAACSVPPPEVGNKVIAYLMIADTVAGADGKLGILMNQLGTTKPNFNRLILSFLQPTFTNYTKGSLACSGILGFYCAPTSQVGAEQHEMMRQAQLKDGISSFNALKTDIAKLKAQGVEVFLAIGGWDYSCNAQLYCKSLTLYNTTITPATCDTAPYGSFCEPPDQPQKFDWFPDPNSADPTEKNNAQLSYPNVVALAKDLGAAGIDLDYEEFWHADWNRRDWNANNTFTSYINTGGNIPQQRFDALTYADLNNPANGWISAAPNHKITSGGTFAMPDTVAKVVAITEALVSASGSQTAGLRFSTAAPAVGGTPILTPQSGSDKTETNGSVWWGGNLKGLIYNMAFATATADRPNGILDDFDTISVMSYDLGPNDFQPPLNTLPNQVGYYVREYNIWGQNNPILPKPGTTGYNDVVPKQFAYKGHIAFGFEIGQPAYPKDSSWTQLALTQQFVATILANRGAPTSNVGHFDADAMIMWEMYKPTAPTGPANQATPLFALQQTCISFGLQAQGFCQSPAPMPISLNKPNP